MNNEPIKIRERVRRTPPFTHVGVLSSVKYANVLHSNTVSGHAIVLDREFSPYVNYIPLAYVCAKPTHFIDQAYVNLDLPTRFQFAPSYENVAFTDISIKLTTQGRTVVRSTGSYSLIHDDNPHILACILPENLVYQKLHILKTGTVDLSKVIILIDKELDEVTFPHKTLRTLYRTELLPEIVKTSATVFKVPLDFIIDNCFYKQSLLPSNIVERRKFKEQMLEDFRKRKQDDIFISSSQSEVASRPSDVITGGHAVEMLPPLYSAIPLHSYILSGTTTSTPATTTLRSTTTELTL